MLTSLTVKNFKRFREDVIELGNPVVFIGPNNSGKTSALQALGLWDAGLKRWNEKRRGTTGPGKRPGVTINRRDLIAIPVPEAKLLWRDLHVRDVQRTNGKQDTKNIRIEIIVEGVTEDRVWKCGLEFDYANDESLYCRPLQLAHGSRMPIPDSAAKVQVAFLPPMSGLAANETRLDPGAINVRIGEGRTAEVLRNLCYKIYSEDPDRWQRLTERIRLLFGAELEAPEYVTERGEIRMRYQESGTSFDIASSGRGLQQILLLLSHMYVNPNAVLLLDEPDAHLEILRQRQVYQLLVDVAREFGNQVIAASHSEVLLNEAAGREDAVIAFVGRPHRITDRGSQVQKALREIGFEHYYQAEQTGWVLYLEGSTDLAILRAFAETLDHRDALGALERPYVHYVANQVKHALSHFHGLREAIPHLAGLAIFDRIALDRQERGIEVMAWQRREIENYLCYPETLDAYAEASAEVETAGPLFASAERESRLRAMRESIQEVEQALQTLGRGSPWSPDTKVSDDFLTPLFEKYFAKLKLPNLMAKKNFHELAYYVPAEKIDPEVNEKLDAIVAASRRAQPRK
jgi:ABC-type taurine transport system ATPase subunit